MSRVEHVGVHGVGLYLPPEIRRNDWWPEETVRNWRVKSGESLVRPRQDREDPATPGAQAVIRGMADVKDDPFRGAVERRVMPQGMVTSDMEAAAARDALARAGLEPGEVGLLLTNSQLPDYLSVPTAPIVHRKLGLSERCMSMGTEAACNSFLTQLSLAEQMIKGGVARYALLVQSSGYLHLARPEDPHSAWFGDAATAVVVGPVSAGRGVLGQAHRTDGSMADALVTGCPGARWSDGKPYLYVENPAAARKMLMRIADQGKQVVDEALAQAGATVAEVGFYAAHQATAWFRKATQEFIGMTNARSFDCFSWTGSLGASNLPFCLGMGEREGLLKPGDLVATYTGGSGITWSSVVLRWGK
jgi:3-oxoacyl-[acyl-carrier-protein] synthase-3